MSTLFRLTLGRFSGPLCSRACSPLLVRCSASSSDVRQWSGEWERKNRRLGRPMSPHLSIYKYQLTSVLSITHRATGLALHSGLLALASASLLLPDSFPHYLSLVSASPLGWGALVLGKVALSWMFFYHLANGVRHLFWDVGHGFSLPALYRSGYIVLAAATLATLFFLTL